MSNPTWCKENSPHLSKEERVAMYQQENNFSDTTLLFHLSFMGDELGFSTNECLEFYNKYVNMQDNPTDEIYTKLRQVVAKEII
jgi:hypothetical protein